MITSERSSRRFLIGLGNPGKEYEHTYHNVGRLALDEIVRSLHGGETPSFSHPPRAHFEYVRTGNLIFIRPRVFMNESGMAIQEALSFFKGKPEETILLHDDSDLRLGSWKYASLRGTAGHHGVESAVQALGGNAFARIRIGTRPKDTPGVRKKAGEFVLRPIRREDEKLLQLVFTELMVNVTEKL